jgi:hypothetical protein
LRLTTLALTPLFLALASNSLSAEKPAAPMVLRYQLKAGESLRYRVTADVHFSVPILDSPEPTEANATVKIVYVATPKTKLADGASDIEFNVDSAELTLEQIPFPIEDSQAKEILNQTISMANTGEVKQVRAGKALPFGVSIPGVDPKRLYALLFPIVFREAAVKPGDKWNYKSELLGGQGTSPVFTATVLPAGSSSTATDTSAALKADFQMAVDQKLDKDKKPVKEGATVRYTRQGKIEGTGTFKFDRTRGRVDSGTVTIKANVKEDLVGAPDRDDQPKQMISKVDATVRVQLEPAGAPSAKTVVGLGAQNKEKS